MMSNSTNNRIQASSPLYIIIYWTKPKFRIAMNIADETRTITLAAEEYQATTAKIGRLDEGEAKGRAP